MTRQTLAGISVRKIERFLEEFANIEKDDEGAALAFARRFEKMLSDLPSPGQWQQISSDADSTYSPGRTLELMRIEISEQDMPVNKTLEFRRISYFSSVLQSIWKASTPQEKRFRILGLHQLLARTWNPTFLLTNLVSAGPFAAAILYFLENAERALICRNPDCPACFFFRKRKGQKYCSEKCAGFGQKIAKRKWWREEGEIWRRERQKSQSGRNLDKKRKQRKRKGEIHP